MSTIPANTPEPPIISESETTLGAQPSRPKQSTPTVHHYAAPDADRQRGSEYAEVLAYETQQRKNAADRIGRGKHSAETLSTNPTPRSTRVTVSISIAASITTAG